MIEKDPLSYEWLTYLWVLVVSLWGGVSNYVKRVTGKESVTFSLAELIGGTRWRSKPKTLPQLA